MRDWEIDVKIPGDAADQQTTDAQTAIPPVEFYVARGVGGNLVQIHDRQAVQNRFQTSSYRVYFLPIQFASVPVGTTPTVGQPVVYGVVRQAGQKVASLVTDIKAPGFGTILKYTDNVNLTTAGYYYCVAVNRAGVEAPPEHIVRMDAYTSNTALSGSGSVGGSSSPAPPPPIPAISVESTYGYGLPITGVIDGVNVTFTMTNAFGTYDLVIVDGLVDAGSSAVGTTLTTGTPPISGVVVVHLAP